MITETKPELTAKDLKDAEDLLCALSKFGGRIGSPSFSENHPAYYASNRAWWQMNECVRLIRESL